MSVNELARYLMVSRQNLSGLVSRMTRDGHLEVVSDELDRRAKLIRMSEHGRKVWIEAAQPKIREYYQAATENMSTTDLAHTLHYLIKLLDNMEKIDLASENSEP